VWRKTTEGLQITAKGSKEGKKQVRFLVGIAHGGGVVLCQQVEGRIKGVDFARIISSGVYESAIAQSADPSSRTVVQDNCPVQNSLPARNAFEHLGIDLFKIPARSPDINCIENLFALVKRELRKDAQKNEIKKETKEQFTQRVAKTLDNFDKTKINSLINSLPNRVKKLIELHGDHIPY